MLRKVFLVEDETVIREGLRDRIPWDQFGYRFVGEAADGEMALPLIRKTKPDVLITDIKMPFMDGLSLSKIVSKEVPRMKIILISGYDDFAYAVEMLRNGVREYILKPIEREKITEILKKLNAEIESRKEKEENNQKIGYQQMRHLMLSDEISGEEQRTIESQYADHFYTGNYYNH